MTTIRAAAAIRNLRRLLGGVAVLTAGEDAAAGRECTVVGVGLRLAAEGVLAAGCGGVSGTAGIDSELAAAERPLSVSRFKRCKSARMSAELWLRRLRSFSRSLLMMSSSFGGRSGFRQMGETGARSRIA